jgi:internalin A
MTNFNTAKVLVVGEERAGKTSLVRRVLRLDFDQNEKSTQGIDLHRLKNKVLGLSINLWDCAGQEVTHFIHEVFMGVGLYVYVLKAEDLDLKRSKIYNWLDVIKSNGKNPPILIVVTQCDLYPSAQFDIRCFQEEYNIVEVLYTSACVKNVDVDPYEIKHPPELVRQIILREVVKLQNGGVVWENSGFKLKQGIFDTLKYSHAIAIDMFYDLGTSLGLTEKESLLYLEQLNKSGDLVYLGKDTIYNSKELVQTIYRTVRSRYLAEEGSHFSEYVYTKTFPSGCPFSHSELMSILMDLDIGYEASGKMSVPFVTHRVQPDLGEFETDKHLALRIKFCDLLKLSVIPIFTVKMGSYVLNKDHRNSWRRGVLLEYKSSYGYVCCDENKKIITVVVDKNPDGKALLNLIEGNFISILKDRFRYDIQIPLIFEGKIFNYSDKEFVQACLDGGDNKLYSSVGKQSKSFSPEEVLLNYS